VPGKLVLAAIDYSQVSVSAKRQHLNDPQRKRCFRKTLNSKEIILTVMELGSELRDMYQNATNGESVCMVHLFGVKRADEIRSCGASCKDIAKAAGINESYAVEINKGVNLARYVEVKTV